MRIHHVVALAVTLAACNQSVVPNFNAATGLPHSAAAFQSEVTGAFDAGRTDIGNFELFMDGFARNSAYFTSSEQRFVLVSTGSIQVNPGDVFVGPVVWDFYYQGIKAIDSVIGSIPIVNFPSASGVAPLPHAQQQAVFGVMETLKALYYMYIIETRDTLGIPVNGVGRALNASPAPILCSKDVWAEIVQMLDSAQDSLVAAGPSTTVGPIVLPPGLSQVSANAGTLSGFTLALRGKARIELAYATGRPTDTLTAGTPNTAQLDSAIADIQSAAPIYNPSLTPAEAVAATDFGVFHTFSTASNDVLNPINTNAGATFLLYDALADIDVADNRFTAKYADSHGFPTSPGAPIATSYHFANNISGSAPIPIIRNVELQLLLAEAEIALGQYTAAIAVLNNLRVNVGGLPAATVTPDFVNTRNFFLREQRVSLLTDGEGDRVLTLRNWNLVVARDTTWVARNGPDATAVAQRSGAADYHTSIIPIPLGESDARRGNIAPVCP